VKRRAHSPAAADLKDARPNKQQTNFQMGKEREQKEFGNGKQ
jgi:hypothetical protein